MRALLILPSFRGNHFGAAWRKNPTITPPLGLLYIGGALERSGFQVRVLDMNVQAISQAEFKDAVRQSDLIGVSVLTVARDIAEELIREVRTIHPRVKVMAGGPHLNSTMTPLPGADVSFVGEGEETAGEVGRILVEGDLDRLRQFRGLFYFDGQEMVRTGLPMVLGDLNLSPRPARHLVDASRYGELIGIRVSDRVAAMTTSRGCPYKCSFCVRRGVFRYRDRTPENVVDEIAEIAAAGHDLLIFNEDNFTVVPERSIAVMREIKRRGIKIRIMMQLRVDSVSEEMLQAFKDAGVWSLIFGIESGTQEILDFYDKGATVEQGRRAVLMAERLGIFSYAFFILGAPPERERHFDENIRFMTSVPLDFVGFNILDVQAGSSLWAKERRRGLIRADELVTPTGPRLGALPYEKLEEQMRRAYRAFYLRPSHYWRLLRKCWGVRDFTLLVFMARFSLKLLRHFHAFALAEDLSIVRSVPET